MSLVATMIIMGLAQGGKPTATVKFATPTATVGKAIKGTVTLVLPEGLHGYQNPPADEFENPIKLSLVDKGFKLGKVEYPKGVDLTMAGADKPTKVYEGTVEIPFTMTPAAVGAKPISVKIDYQLCSMNSCWPPSSIVVKAPLKVIAAPKKAKS